MIGQTILHYEILEQLGGGGMGVVYKARDAKLRRTVALKFLPPDLSKNGEANARFVQEAQAASALDHPNICTIHDIRETDDGRLFIVMAYYEGQTLKYRLGDGALSIDEATDIVRQTAEGLEAAHEAGIVHRDIKPANIMVTNRGRVKILDFGIAKLAGTTDLTKTGSTVGTAHYMSPEQIRGEQVDHRTDFWSLGVVLYQMLTGRRPFEGQYEQAVSYAILNQEPDDLPPDVPEALQRLCGKLLEKNVEERLRDTSHVLTELGLSHDHEQMEWAQRRRLVLSRKRWLAFGVPTASALVVLLILAVVQLSRSGDEEAVQTGPAILENTIAVMPFAVGGDQLAYLDESMVDLLSLGLQGAGDLHTIDPNTILGSLGEDRSVVRDPERARRTATHLGASRFVLGSVTQLGPQIRINASLYDAEGKLLQQAEARAPSEEHLASMVDTLVVQLVAGQVAAPLRDFVPLAAKSTSSFEALKAYLRGEYAFRQARFGEGADAFEEAFRLDTTFALAMDRVRDWRPTRDANVRLTRHQDRLPERERMLFEAEPGERPADSFKERVGYMQEVIARYPNFSHAWFRLGDFLHHRAYQNGMMTSDARRYLERALRLDPNNAEVLTHLIDLAVGDRDFDRADSLAARYPHERLSQRILGAVWRRDNDTLDTLLPRWKERLHPDGTLLLALSAVKHLEEAPFALRMLDLLRDGPAEKNRVFIEGLIEAARGRFWVSDSLMVRHMDLTSGGRQVGVVTTICVECPLRKGYLTELRRRIAQIDTSRVPSEMHGREKPELKAYLSGLVAFRLEDDSAFLSARNELDAIASRKPVGSLAGSLTEMLESLIHWREGNLDDAIEAVERTDKHLDYESDFSGLDIAPVLHHDYIHNGFSPIYNHTLDRYIRAELLLASGRYEDALPWFVSLVKDGWWSVAYQGPALLRCAEIYEQLGDKDKAMEFYQRFIKLWKDADPEVQPLVDEARRALDELIKGELREPER